MKKNKTFLIILIILMTIAIKCMGNSENKKIIKSGVSYSLNIDGVSADSLPTSGYYYLTSYTCNNGTILTWDIENHDLYIEGTSASNDQCYLNFETTPSLSSMKPGDYVAYVGNNGCNNGVSGKTGGSAAEAGNACLGENANQSIDTSGYTYGYCNSSAHKFIYYGWRIAYIENNYVHLVSAGSPECPSSSEEFDTIALDYCNATYVYGGTCSSSNTWAMGEADFQKILNTGNTFIDCWLTGTTRDDPKGCGYFVDKIDIGGDYWVNYTDSDYCYYWSGDGRGFTRNDCDYFYGIRPIIKLSTSVYISGGTGTMENPYTIAI